MGYLIWWHSKWLEACSEITHPARCFVVCIPGLNMITTYIYFYEGQPTKLLLLLRFFFSFVCIGRALGAYNGAPLRFNQLLRQASTYDGK